MKKAAKKAAAEETKAEKEAAAKEKKAALSPEERKRTSDLEAVKLLKKAARSGEVTNDAYEIAKEAAHGDQEVITAIETIKKNAKPLAGIKGKENDHLSVEELGFIEKKLGNKSWGSLEKAVDYGAEHKLWTLIKANNDKEKGTNWADLFNCDDTALELDGGDDEQELKKAIGDDDKTLDKLKELKKKFEKMQDATGEHDSAFDWTDGDEISGGKCENVLKAIERGWTMNEVLDKGTDKLKDKKIEHWDDAPVKEEPSGGGH